jgi:hypothetical protein
MGKLVISLFLLLAAAGPALAQAAATKPPAAAPSPSTSPSSTTTNPPSPSTSAPSTRFTTESAAKAHCPDDTVVWVASSRSRVYHLTGDRSYGRSRRGAYICLKDAQSAGMRQSRRRVTTSSSAPKPASASTGTSGSTNK